MIVKNHPLDSTSQNIQMHSGSWELMKCQLDLMKTFTMTKNWEVIEIYTSFLYH